MVTLPAFKIREIILIIISLLLKGNGTIGFMSVSEDDKPGKPFDEIPNIKENIKHFFHLLGMYLFVIKSLITNRSVSSSEENPEEVHVTETYRGNNFILDNLHTR